MESPAGKARAILGFAAEPGRVRLERHLLVAAALRALLSKDPIVVGGTAEEYWSADEYHETDLDLCAPISKIDEQAMIDVGFMREGRHWYHADARVAVEFPDSRLDGDESRTKLVALPGGAHARIIGVDDLYLDRLRQATMNEGVEGTEFHSALHVAGSCLDILDRPYIDASIRKVVKEEPLVGASMKRLDTKIFRRVRRTLKTDED